MDFERLFDGANLPAPLDTASRYAMANGGKRVRPLLVCASYLSVCDGLVDDMLRRAMMAVELLHGYSLVHDDLPCMDDDELRRGKPTCHVVYGEDVALLAGDVLQSLAFEVLTADIAGFEQVKEMTAFGLLQVFVPRARRMVSGQMLDVVGEAQTLSQSELESIHVDKTGALIEASVLMGAVCAGASKEQLAQLIQFAKCLGLAYQVQDDVLDVVSDTATLGKPAGSDDKLQKSTYVKLLGVDGAATYADELYTQAIRHAKNLQIGTTPSLLIELVLWLQQRQK
ncbi:MAG: polyprenyl synthetase family protein [Moraxella sp.]|nr:polyprenyl synthetase family protein [Moraxella sp.]